MNLRHSFLAVIAATSLVGVSAPAQAASFLGVPENTTPGTAIGGAGPKASFPYFNSTFVGDGSTYSFSVVDTGLGSRGRALSAFGVFTGSVGAGSFTSLLSEVKPYDTGSKANTNDWLGTCNGGSIAAPCTINFTFKKGENYTLGLLTKGTGASTYGVSQADSYTFRKVSDQFNNSSTVTVADSGSVFLGFEDGDFKKGGSSYWHDYQDWVVKADVVESVPEPASLAGLAMVAGGLITARRRKSADSAKA